jgi:anti-sigma B factor antagonist
MTIETENFDGGIVRLKLEGRMDAQGAEDIDAKLMAFVCAHRSIILDMNAVGFLASMGIRTLVLAGKAATRRGGKMVLLNPAADVTKVLEIAGIGDLIPIHRSLDEALRAVSL